jgi:C4-type Zn-finger protein
MESNAKPLFGHYENIICPECKSVELAYIEYLPLPLFNILIHHCSNCKYIIQESEWHTVPKIVT